MKFRELTGCGKSEFMKARRFAMKKAGYDAAKAKNISLAFADVCDDPAKTKWEMIAASFERLAK